jgi:hypothetical protein
MYQDDKPMTLRSYDSKVIAVTVLTNALSSMKKTIPVAIPALTLAYEVEGMPTMSDLDATSPGISQARKVERNAKSRKIGPTCRKRRVHLTRPKQHAKMNGNAPTKAEQ